MPSGKKLICPTCNQERKKRHWTKAQWKQTRPAVGGRNECLVCWVLGPTSADWKEVEDLLETVTGSEYQNLDLRFQDFMISFLKTIGPSRKGWSYHGVLPVRVPSDYSTKHHPDVFDPTNYVYSRVVLRNVPDLQHRMGWLCEPSWETMGDCIESLLAYANAGKQHQWKQVGTLEAAHFFREMSYS